MGDALPNLTGFRSTVSATELRNAFTSAIRELIANAKQVKDENIKLNRAKVEFYARAVKERKNPNFQFTDSEIARIFWVVEQQQHIFDAIKSALSGGLAHLDFKATSQDQRSVVSSYKSVMAYVNELDEIFTNQEDVLKSNADNRIKASAFLDLFTEERKLYNQITKAEKSVANLGIVKKAMNSAAKARFKGGFDGSIQASLMVGLTLLMISPKAMAGGSEPDWGGWVSDVGDFAVQAWKVFWGGMQNVGETLPGVAGIALVSGSIYLVIRVIRWRRNRP